MRRKHILYDNGIIFSILEYSFFGILFLHLLLFFSYLFIADSYIYLFIIKFFNFKYSVFLFLIFIFFVFNLYRIRISLSSNHIRILSRNTFLRKKNYIKIHKDSILAACIFNRRYTFNHILCLKIHFESGQKKIFRFLISFVSKESREKILNTLNNFIYER